MVPATDAVDPTPDQAPPAALVDQRQAKPPNVGVGACHPVAHRSAARVQRLPARAGEIRDVAHEPGVDQRVGGDVAETGEITLDL